MWPSSFWPGSPAPRGAVRRAGAGEGAGVAHRAPLQPGRGALCLAGALHRVRQLLLLLVRHEAPCHIPDSVRRNLEEHSWV